MSSSVAFPTDAEGWESVSLDNMVHHVRATIADILGASRVPSIYVDNDFLYVGDRCAIGLFHAEDGPKWSFFLRVIDSVPNSGVFGGFVGWKNITDIRYESNPLNILKRIIAGLASDEFDRFLLTRHYCGA